MKLPKKIPKKIPKGVSNVSPAQPPLRNRLPPLPPPPPHPSQIPASARKGAALEDAAPTDAAPRNAAPRNAAPKPRPFVPNPTSPPQPKWRLEEELKRRNHEARVSRWRGVAFMGGGLAVFGLGLYTAILYVSLTEEADWNGIPADLSDRFDKEAEGYDEKVNMSEWMLGLTSRRKAMTERVKGHVLEVAVGTGRNTAYYPTKQCDTVTLLDSSAPMLAVAKRKWKDTHPEYFSRVFFKKQSALDPITPPYGAQDGYDTVIETMGLCSTPEPERLLQSLEAATKEDGGQILLLEHGKSHYEWLNGLLDKTAPSHALEHGCWWNRDIGKIVEDSGLEVVEIKRYNFGTTWWVELRPRKGHGYKQPILEQIREVVAPPAESPASQKSWWAFWR